MTKKSSYIIGVDAENRVEQHLIAQGYNIIHNRYKTKYGEIDIIAQKDDILAMVEVKSRSQNMWDSPVSKRQQQRIIDSSKILIAQSPQYTNLQIRYDVAIIIQNEINYIENAFLASS